MDFNKLLAKMKEFDAPSQSAVSECGDMPSAMPVTQPHNEQQTPPPSMTVNLNAHGMSDIESMMKLFQKVNPDMMPKDPAPMPSLSAPPSLMSITPTDGPKPINKLLPDLSDEPVSTKSDSMNLPPDHDKDHELVKKLDRDGDGDHDMDDHKAEPKKDETYANEPNETEFELNKSVFGGDDLHKEKKTFPKVNGGDNPMQKMESGDLRAQIRAELLQRLSEAKSR